MGIQPYNANVMHILGNRTIGDSLWKIFYGIELEYEINPKSKIVLDFVEATPPAKRASLFAGEDQKKNTPVAHYVCDAICPLIQDFAIVKRDGSLANGIEVVSLPMSLDAHRAQWIPFFKDLDKYGLAVRASCGMHVHVSKDLLTNFQIGKILAFIHDPANMPFIQLIAGRKPPVKYANITEPKKISDVKKHADSNPNFRNRYDGFNITGGATIEFRFFKGTSSLARMLTNLDFCAAMVGFTWPGTVGLGQNNLDGFLKFVEARRKEYAHLHEFLVAKKLLKELKKKGKKKHNQPIAV